MYRDTAEAGQAWKGYTQEPGSGISKLGHCPQAPGVLHADLSVQGARPYPFLAPGHHVSTLLLAITGLPFGHVNTWSLSLGPESYSKWFPKV